MEIDINLNKISQDELINLYNTVSNFISYLDTEIKTAEVEKKK